MGMSKEAINKFLSEERLGVLGTNRKDGSPHMVPLWYFYDGENFWMSSDKEANKVKNARRDPRSTLCIDEESRPYKGVVVYGAVTLTEENLAETRRAIISRYLNEAEVAKYKSPHPHGTILLKLTPDRFYSWDYGSGH